MSERIGSHGWRIWKEKGLPQEVVPLSDAEGVVAKLEEELEMYERDETFSTLAIQLAQLEAENVVLRNTVSLLKNENERLTKLLEEQDDETG